MRLLFLSNFYPPADRGGWEQWCQEVADALIDRGHQVTVLTSRYRTETIREPESHVHRSLYLESDLNHYNPLDFFLRLPWRDRHNHRYLEKVIKMFQPDVTFIWGMWQLNPQLAVLAEQLCPGRVGYYLCGLWPLKEREKDPHIMFWQMREQKKWVQLLKQPVAWLALRTLRHRRRRWPEFRHVACVSQFILDTLRNGGLELPGGRVIYGGIKLEEFYRPLDVNKPRLNNNLPLCLLFAGAVIPQKGVDTAVQAMARIAEKFDPKAVHLTIVGAGHPDFEESLRRLVRENDIELYVTFRGWVHKKVMPQLIQDFDILLFPSTWQEPLARMMMEGMAAGLALVSTTTGGTKEFLKHGRNSLSFQAGDSEGLARQIERLLNEPCLVRRLALAGQQTALDEFDFKRMVDELESFVEQIARQSPRVCA